METNSTQEIKNLARKLGMRPSKMSGQHFLIDKNILNEIISIASIKKDEPVLEVGPGFGVLTHALTKKGAHVLAVEKDPKLAANLSKVGKSGKLTVAQKDILKF